MNISVLKEDFYKRFGKVNEFLYSEECGMNCTLLGFFENEKINSLNTMLYPNVTTVGCADNTTKITVSRTSSTNQDIYYTKSSGAKILLHNDIPPSFNSRISEDICIEKLLERFNYNYDSSFIDKYYSRKGYCKKTTVRNSREYPLPMTGYNLVNVYFQEEKKFFDISKLANKSFETVKKLLPDTNTFADISENDISHINNKIDDFEILNFIRFVCEENERIEIACERLLKLDIDTLFSQIVLSAKSMNLYFNVPETEKNLFKVISVIPTVKAYRYNSTGMFFFVAENEVDYTINAIRNDFMTKYGTWLNFCISGM